MTTMTCGSNDTCTTMTTGTTTCCNNICEPGAYVCNWNGYLLRVTENCFDAKGNCWMTFEGNGNMNVTFISDNPNCTLEQARESARACGVTCNF